MIKMIWCEDIKRGVGIGNHLPWNIKEEMQHFIKQTRNKIVVMGENTFKSIGKPLPNRINVVLSDNHDFVYEGITIYNDYKKLMDDYKNKEIFIIGGISIYNLFSAYATHLIVSHLNEDYKCDRFINVNFNNFNLMNVDKFDKFEVKYYERKK